MVLKLPPLPITPSRSEDQESAAVSAALSSSASVTLPAKLTLAPKVKFDPFAGDEIVTTGTAPVALTVIVMAALSLNPPESVTDAVIICVPTLSVEIEKLPPFPMTPSRSELQLRAAVSVALLSSASVAEPVKEMEAA